MEINRNRTGFIGGRPFSSGQGTSMIGALHSNFGGDSAPPPLDLSEFPSLSSCNTDSSQPNPMAGRQPYGKYLSNFVFLYSNPLCKTIQYYLII